MMPAWLTARIQAQTNRFLTDSATIERLDLVTGDLGQPVERWSVVSAATACRVIGTAESRTAVSQGQEQMTDVYRIIFPAGTTIDKQYRVTVASSGYVYQVAGVEHDMTDEVFVAVTAVRQR